jgi:hypothetical protein
VRYDVDIDKCHVAALNKPIHVNKPVKPKEVENARREEWRKGTHEDTGGASVIRTSNTATNPSEALIPWIPTERLWLIALLVSCSKPEMYLMLVS